MNTNELKNCPIVKVVDLIQSAHFALSSPDMGGANYRKAKRNIEDAHKLCPALLNTRPTADGEDGLKRIIIELIARRGGAESLAVQRKEESDFEASRQWSARAAGIAEAISVVQMFGDAAMSARKEGE